MVVIKRNKLIKAILLIIKLKWGIPTGFQLARKHRRDKIEDKIDWNNFIIKKKIRNCGAS